MCEYLIPFVVWQPHYLAIQRCTYEPMQCKWNNEGLLLYVSNSIGLLLQVHYGFGLSIYDEFTHKWLWLQLLYQHTTIHKLYSPNPQLLTAHQHKCFVVVLHLPHPHPLITYLLWLSLCLWLWLKLSSLPLQD